MIRITQLKLDIDHDENELRLRIFKKLKISNNQNFTYKISKKSIDARDKNQIKFIYSIDVDVENEKKVLKSIKDKNISCFIEKKYEVPFLFSNKNKYKQPIIVGSGPSGLFAAYFMVLSGLKPIIIEQGEDVDKRLKTVTKFWENNVINSCSNVQFGEGGAGTFSDGKLNTMVNDKVGRNKVVLETFVKFGAPEEILYINKPHIGTDILMNVVKNMRKFIIKNGGEVLFNTKLVDLVIKNNKLEAIKVINDNIEKEMCCENLILAIGHSSRDTFKMLYKRGVFMTAKSFAVGVRIEHPQEMINLAQYGCANNKYLPVADYKLTHKTDKGRSVFSFCMCPGGYVVNSSSESDRLCVNGMSYSKRDSDNANSAIIVSVTPDDFSKNHPLAGISFQEELEKKAYKVGNSFIPNQLYIDYKENRKSSSFGKIHPITKGETKFSNLRDLFTEDINLSIISGIERFGKIIKGFNREDCILSGVESRTSSPVRIVRNDDFQSNIKGIYPCGEGAGYAGGITSAAIDGIKVFEEFVKMLYD